MQRKPKPDIKKNASYFLTMTVVGWLDVFTRQNHRDAIIESLKYCIENKGLNVYAYCIMSNHIHLVVNCNEPFQLKDTIRDFKKFTSKKIISQILTEPESRREWLYEYFKNRGIESSKNKNFKFWQTGNYAIELYSEKFTWTKINYIHNNPVKANLVSKPEDWIYSSATNYAELDSILELVYCLPQTQRVYH